MATWWNKCLMEMEGLGAAALWPMAWPRVQMVEIVSSVEPPKVSITNGVNSTPTEWQADRWEVSLRKYWPHGFYSAHLSPFSTSSWPSLSFNNCSGCASHTARMQTNCKTCLERSALRSAISLSNEFSWKWLEFRLDQRTRLRPMDWLKHYPSPLQLQATLSA